MPKMYRSYTEYILYIYVYMYVFLGLFNYSQVWQCCKERPMEYTVRGKTIKHISSTNIIYFEG